MAVPPDGRLDEEAKGLLRLIVERQAYRQRMAANIRGHGLKFLPDLAAKLRVTEELAESLRRLATLEEIYEAIGGIDLTARVMSRMERIPYPATRLELAACLALTGRAERAVASTYARCPCQRFARLAGELQAADRTHDAGEEERFVVFAADPPNRVQAQRYWERWLTLCLQSLGRPGTPGDERAYALGLRDRRAADLVALFIEEVEPLRAAGGLDWPDLARRGVDLPRTLTQRMRGEGA
jgi:hypothetical protein